MKSILDRSFRYTPSSQTDLRKTFARVRREQAKADEAAQREVCEKVKPMRKVAK
jgi:hypothetical protein